MTAPLDKQSKDMVEGDEGFSPKGEDLGSFSSASSTASSTAPPSASSSALASASSPAHASSSASSPAHAEPETQPEAQPATQPETQQKKKLNLRVVLLVVCIAVALACGAYVLSGRMQVLFPAGNSSSSSAEANLAENPVDFAALQKQNPDIVGWISIPDTLVDDPILRSTQDDAYYLTHDENGETSVSGSVYMEMTNSPAFTDYVTVLYGHNMRDGSKFATLHYFENNDFFNECGDITVCIPGHILTYNIISAYIYDDRHILNSFNFNYADVRTNYYNSVLNPISLVANVKQGVELQSEDKILQLSTCISAAGRDNQRLIVTGVLANDQPTK